MKKIIRFLCAATIVAFFSLPFLAEACTLWAGAGESIVGGGTIISKNRDWLPDHQQQLRLIVQGGYRFISLYAVGNDASGTKAGVNEKGLVVVSASPPSYLEKPENYTGKTSVRNLLTRYDSVEAAINALEREKWVCGPEYLVLSDGKEIACIEFGLNGSYDIISRVSSGTVFHTNHYLSQNLVSLNQGKYSNSQSRYNRIKGFLESKDRFNVEDFQQYSVDPVLWREGTTPFSTRTLSSWIIRQLPSGVGTLYLKMANPGKPIKEYQFALRDLFDGKVELSHIE